MQGIRCVVGRIKLRSLNQSYLLRTRVCYSGVLPIKHYSNNSNSNNNNNDNNQLSKRKERMGKLRTVLKEYGAVGVVFHTVISLASLGSCYMAVKSGLYVHIQSILVYFNIDLTSDAYKAASTMGVAYILHKMLLPIRAFVTISCVPLIVRYLRAKGIMKTTAKSNKQI